MRSEESGGGPRLSIFAFLFPPRALLLQKSNQLSPRIKHRHARTHGLSQGASRRGRGEGRGVAVWKRKSQRDWPLGPKHLSESPCPVAGLVPRFRAPAPPGRHSHVFQAPSMERDGGLRPSHAAGAAFTGTWPRRRPRCFFTLSNVSRALMPRPHTHPPGPPLPHLHTHTRTPVCPVVCE